MLLALGPEVLSGHPEGLGRLAGALGSWVHMPRFHLPALTRPGHPTGPARLLGCPWVRAWGWVGCRLTSSQCKALRS